MTYLAIVTVSENRVAKFQPFEDRVAAEAHVKEFGGFVHETRHPPLLLHVEDGKVTELDPPSPELPTLTSRQFRLALVNLAGQSLAGVDAVIDAITDPTARDNARIEWEYANEFRRDHPMIDTIAGALGISAKQVDALWERALSL